MWQFGLELIGWPKMMIRRIPTKVLILGVVFLFLVGCVGGGKTYTVSGTVVDFKGKNITLTSIDPEDPHMVAATVIDGGGIGTVVRIAGGETNAVLTGFTITNGSGSFDNIYRGGGVFLNYSTSVISHNIIEGNKADNGGGIYIGGWYLHTIEANTVRDNVAVLSVAGIYISGGLHVISNNTISDQNTIDASINSSDEGYAVILDFSKKR